MTKPSNAAIAARNTHVYRRRPIPRQKWRHFYCPLPQYVLRAQAVIPATTIVRLDAIGRDPHIHPRHRRLNATVNTDIVWLQEHTVNSLNDLVGDVTLVGGLNITCTPSGNTIIIAGAACANDVRNIDGSLTISPITGDVIASLNVAHANTWTAFQTFAAGLAGPFGVGGHNEGYGVGSGNGSASGTYNLGIGENTLHALTTGFANMAIGGTVLQLCTTGTNNMGIGVGTLASLTDGTTNVAIGTNAMSSAVHSQGNVYLGYTAGQLGTSSDYNVGIGYAALNANTANRNVAIGVAALQSNTSGTENIAIGNAAGYANITGSYNTWIGDLILFPSGVTNLNYTVGLGWQAAPQFDFEFALSPKVNRVTFHGLSSTTTDRIISHFRCGFVSNTDATYTGTLDFSAYDYNGARTCIIIAANGSVGLIGFLGAAAVVAQTGDAGTALVAFGLMSGTPTFAAANITGTGGLFATIVGNDRKTGLTAAQALATYTVGAADASYVVSANVLVTTSVLHSFTVTVTYTDESNTSRTLTLNFSTLAGVLAPTITNTSGAGPYEGVPTHIRCKAATTIVVQTTGTFTTVTYNFEERIVLN